MSVRSLLLASMVAIAVPVVAVAQDAQPEQAQPAKEKKICRRGPPATGSIMMSRPICHTKAEWAKIDEQNERDTHRVLGHVGSLQPNGAQ